LYTGANGPPAVGSSVMPRNAATTSGGAGPVDGTPPSHHTTPLAPSGHGLHPDATASDFRAVASARRLEWDVPFFLPPVLVSPMSERPWLQAMFTVLMAAAVGVLAVRAARRPEPPVPATPRALAADPDFYAGRAVRVPLAGFEPAGPAALAYRPFVPGPASVVVVFAGAAPDPPPPYAVGVCRGGSPVVVADAAPHYR
jgi:hypothetical protein